MHVTDWLTPAMILALAGFGYRALSNLEARLGARFDRLETRLDGRIDSLTGEVHQLGIEVAEIRGTLGFPTRQAK